MDNVGTRIRRLRTERSMTHSDLAGLVDLTYVQICRYEKGKSKPSSAVLQKLARALDTTADYLMCGGTDDAAAQLSDRKLLDQFRAVEQLDDDDKHLVETFLDAFVTKRRLQQLAR